MSPDLMIKFANSLLSDDKGEKEILYKNMGVGEYWIVDVRNLEFIEFTIADGGSKKIR
nr:Uma2 family endonuclease [Okeania sp. SIO2F4]